MPCSAQLAVEHLQLPGRDRVGERQVEPDGRDVVVGGGHGEVGPAHAAARHPEAFEGLRGGDLVDQVEVDIEQVGLVTLAVVDDVPVPQLLGQRFRGHALALDLNIWDDRLAIWELYPESASSTRRFPSSTRWRPGPLSLAGLVDATGLPRATAHRLAAALEVHGLVRRDAEGRFATGPRLTGLDLPALAGPALERLRDETGESVQLYVRRGDRRVCVAALESPHGLRTIVRWGRLCPSTSGRPARCSAATRRRGAGAGPRAWRSGSVGVASVERPGARPRGRRGGRGLGLRPDRADIALRQARRYAEAVVDAARAIEAAAGR